MRKYACLKEPLARECGAVYKIMMYRAPEGFYLFEYDSPDAVVCANDRLYDSEEELYEDWNGLIDENGWIAIDDPLLGCQHDAFLPLRVKGRDRGKPEWGKYEVFRGGKWLDYEL